MNPPQIIAMGGGGFSMEPENPALDRYVLGQSGKENPVVCFVPTATGDSLDYTKRFYDAYSKLPCQPRHLSLFKPPVDLAAFVEECDVIYVGGGNTRNMLAIWREWGFDKLVRAAWERGTVLCGLSAGAICWFEQGHTDSAGPYAPMQCLGFLAGSCTPHYDGEPGRRPSVHEYLTSGKLISGYALDDGAALHFRGRELVAAVASRPRAQAYRVRAEQGEIIEERLEMRRLARG